MLFTYLLCHYNLFRYVLFELCEVKRSDATRSWKILFTFHLKANITSKFAVCPRCLSLPGGANEIEDGVVCTSMLQASISYLDN
jgi:hypothetical protein